MVDRQYKSSGAPIVKGNQPRDTGSNEASGLKTKCSPAKDVRTRGPYSVTDMLRMLCEAHEIGRMLQITSDSCTVHMYYTVNDNINPPVIFSLSSPPFSQRFIILL